MSNKKETTAEAFAREAQLVVYVDSRENGVELGNKVQEALTAAGLDTRVEIRLGAAPLRIGSYSK